MAIKVKEQRRLVRALRKKLQLSKNVVSDEELLAMTDGTYGRAKIELKLSLDEMAKAIKAEEKKMLKKLKTAILKIRTLG